MKWQSSRIILTVIAVFLALSLFYFKGFAQFSSIQTVELSPPSQEITVDPGKTVKVNVTVRNPNKETLPITARLEDFTTEGEEGQVQLIEKSSYSLTGWAEVSPKNFSLTPGQSQNVVTTISVPSNAAGGRYGSVVFSVGSDSTKEEGSGAKVAQELASLFLLRISGPVTESLALSSFNAPTFSEEGPIPFSIKLRSGGNIHVKTASVINISDAFNKKVEDIVIKPTNVFPGASRVLQGKLDKKFLIGRYTATAIVYYGSKNESLTATTNFYVFPLKLGLILLIALFILYRMRKRLGKALGTLFKG